LLKLTRPDGKSIITEYEENKPTRLIDPKGAIWLQEWDSHGLLIRKISPLGAESKYQYDNLGMPVSYVDPLGAVTKLNFDNYGNLESLLMH
jgi:YD repeat-containing protein